MPTELCRQAADVAAARCARRDATQNDAFEHLLWLHSCSGSLGVIDARRLSHLKQAGASAALEIARQDILADIQASEHISLSTLDMARCFSDEIILAESTLLICKCVLHVARGTPTTRTPYSREVIRPSRLQCTSARLQPFIAIFICVHTS